MWREVKPQRYEGQLVSTAFVKINPEPGEDLEKDAVLIWVS